jgi:RNA polymerase sigma factor (sigma-70 family)
MGGRSDRELVAQFVAGRDGGEAAFRILLHRHGPMVLGVCRRVLGDPNAAEDAFQATFLVLVRKAGTLRDRDLLANWLYGVALRQASRAKVEAARRQAIERDAGQARGAEAVGDDPDLAELKVVIDEEIGRLPEKYRVPLVLCDLEGLHHHEVARRLGCPVGTVESRLSRARARLRGRLVRRGLAPTAAALAAILMPAPASAAPPTLVEATLAAVARRTAGASAAGAVAWPHAGRALTGLVACTTLVACTALAALALGGSRVSVPPPPPPPPPARPPADQPAPAPIPRAVQREVPPAEAVVRDRAEAPRPSRFPSAVAVPLEGITLDGRLDDWPKGMARHPISNRLRGNSAYDPMDDAEVADPQAYFMVGYGREPGRIYLAVVVRDEDLVYSPGDPWHTDAVEVYVDGLLSDRSVATPGGDWLSMVSADEMPALQYVAVPGPVAAYKDRWGANPSLVYGKIGATATKTAYRREGDVTTYEWSIQVFDSYPDQPTRLEPGKRIGFDVAVVDKDRDRPRPAWLSWGRSPRRFKGFAAGDLGELILGENP